MFIPFSHVLASGKSITPVGHAQERPRTFNKHKWLQPPLVVESQGFWPATNKWLEDHTWETLRRKTAKNKMVSLNDCGHQGKRVYLEEAGNSLAYQRTPVLSKNINTTASNSREQKIGGESYFFLLKTSRNSPGLGDCVLGLKTRIPKGCSPEFGQTSLHCSFPVVLSVEWIPFDDQSVQNSFFSYNVIAKRCPNAHCSGDLNIFSRFEPS